MNKKIVDMRTVKFWPILGLDINCDIQREEIMPKFSSSHPVRTAIASMWPHQGVTDERTDGELRIPYDP